MFKEAIKKSEILYFLARVLQNGNSKEFRKWVTDIIDSPSIIRLECLGDKNPDKVYYVIDINDEGNHSGFFSLLDGTIKRLGLAERLGAVPYIRWTNTPYGYLNHENTYTDYFLQTCNTEFKEILQSRNVIFSRPQDGFQRDDSQVYSEKAGFLDSMGALYKKYIQIQPELINRINEDRGLLIGFKFEHTIGVHVRGTDYRQALKGHPKAVMYEEFVSEIEKLPENYCDWPIFLASDDRNAISFFVDRFSDRVICYQDVFRVESDFGVHYSTDDREEHAFNLGYEVLRDADTLSRCGVLIAGISFVSFTAREMKASRNETYSELRIIDHGINNVGTTSSKFNACFNQKL